MESLVYYIYTLKTCALVRGAGNGVLRKRKKERKKR